MLSLNSPLIGKTPVTASLRNEYDLLAVAVDRNGEFIDSDPDFIFEAGDIVWVAGTEENIHKIK